MPEKELFPLSLSLAMGHGCLSALVDGAFEVLGLWIWLSAEEFQIA